MKLFNKNIKPSLFIIKGHSLFSFQLSIEITEKTDFTVYSYPASEDALTELKAIQPKVIVIDTDAPKGLNPQQAIIAIKNLLPHSLVIILSTGGDAEGAMDLMKSGADSYVKKNGDTIHQLLAEITSLTTVSNLSAA